MKFFTKIGFCLTLVSLFFSCDSDNNFPSTPELTVRSFEKVDANNAVWKLGFTDGDGDIGVRNDQDADNFIVKIFSIEDGIITEQPGLSYRIPVVENIRTERGIEGEFSFRLETDLYRVLTPPLDSIFLSGYVTDRGGKQSNVVETPVFPT